MRIVTGSARGTKLLSLEGLDTRPTADRAKEALFNMLRFDLEGRVALDLFAGSGQLGLEALSCGAERAVFIDSSRAAVDVVTANAKKTRLFEKCKIAVNDYAAYLRSASGREKFHLIFLDPPYASGLLVKALDIISRSDLCADGAIIACESNTEAVYGDRADVAERYEIIKQTRYGKTFITLLTPKKSGGAEDTQ